MNPKSEKIVEEIKKFFEERGFKRAVLGLSGGVDSALTAKLAVLALGKENVTALIMPNRGTSSEHGLQDAIAFAEKLGIKYHVVSIGDTVARYKKLPWKENEAAAMNIQARIRMTVLYHYANSHKALVLGTGNKTELTLGYFTKFGDGACDVLPIGNLFKTEVWELAKELGLPEAIIQKTPSAELKEGHTDEGEIGMSYVEIDEILQRFEAGKKPKTESEQIIYSRIISNKHKGETPLVISSLLY